MSVKEAIERGSIVRSRTIGRHVSETHSPDTRFVEASRKTLRDSKAMEGIDELSGVIRREKDPEVEVKERIHPDGSVSVDISWNRRPCEEKDYPSSNYRYNSITISADPFKDEIAVWSKEETEYIREPMWRNPTGTDPTTVQYALADAYRNPKEMIGPPVLIR